MLWWILILTAVAGIMEDPMWFLATALAILVAIVSLSVQR